MAGQEPEGVLRRHAGLGVRGESPAAVDRRCIPPGYVASRFEFKPGGALGAPMTYLIDDVQHIALTVGGDVSGLVACRVVQP